MHNRIIGILGGMGPEATLDLYRHIISLTPAKCDQDHIRVLIDSHPQIPDRTRAILHGGEDPFPLLLESARLLEKAGAGLLVIPCNAAHYFLPRLQTQIGIPALNMIEETCRVFRAQAPADLTAGLLAATGTVRCGIYDQVFSAAGVEIVVPGEADQNLVHSAISAVKAGIHNDLTKECLHAVGGRLATAGAGAVILGCTEIPLSFDPEHVSYATLNPTRILAQAAVNWALEQGDRRLDDRRE